MVEHLPSRKEQKGAGKRAERRKGKLSYTHLNYRQHSRGQDHSILQKSLSSWVGPDLPGGLLFSGVSRLVNRGSHTVSRWQGMVRGLYGLSHQ